MNYTRNKYRDRLRISILRKLHDAPLFINKCNYEMTLYAIDLWKKKGIHSLINLHSAMSGELNDPIYVSQYLTEEEHIEEFSKCVNSFDIHLTRFIILLLLKALDDKDKEINFFLLSNLIKEFSMFSSDNQYKLLMRIVEVGAKREDELSRPKGFAKVPKYSVKYSKRKKN